jgi:hypothetical protein
MSKKYDQGSQASFGFSKHVPNIQTKEIKDTYNAHQQKGRDTLYVC